MVGKSVEGTPGEVRHDLAVTGRASLLSMLQIEIVSRNITTAPPTNAIYVLQTFVDNDSHHNAWTQK